MKLDTFRDLMNKAGTDYQVYADTPDAVLDGGYTNRNWKLTERLLDFAHAGGIDNFEALITWAETFKRTAQFGDHGPLSMDVTKAKQLLTILDGSLHAHRKSETNKPT